MTVAILYREELKDYDFGIGHPFRGDRYPAFFQFLKASLPEKYYDVISAEPATLEELLKVCDRDYIDFCTEFYHAAAAGWSSHAEDFNHYQSRDNKPMLTPGDVEKTARIIIGGARTACDLVQGGKYQKAISVGGGMHHARRRYGEGFCVYNDVAFAALYLVEKYGLERVLVLDTDAHAGNGTAEYVKSNPGIVFVDIHQNPESIYPGTGFASDIGEGRAKGNTVNIPLPVFAPDRAYEKVFDEIILPLTREFKPQIIVRNGGSDPYFDDGLTTLGMTIGGFKMMGSKVREMAEVCGGKEVDLIASGYNSYILPTAWLSLLAGVADFPISLDEIGEPPHLHEDVALAATEKVIRDVEQFHQPYWKCFDR
ncbi:MAG TPA: histone deacetylase [Dehalococcoidales bacterium]|nr:histone deacetylase [Dehalococcoidales bacterium]